MARPLAAAVPTPPAPWAWAFVGALCGLVVALVLFAPARWMADALARATGGQFLLENPRGTVWNGSGRLVLTGGAGSRDAASLPSRLHWTLRPAPGGAQLELSSPCCTDEPLVVGVQPRWGGFALAVRDGLPSRWPAGLLAGLGTPWNTLQLEGDLRLSTQGLRLEWTRGRTQLAGQAHLDALGLASRLTTLRPMGSYRITVSGGPTPSLHLNTLPESPLQLTGSGQWVGSRLRFTGEASAAPEREAALANLLNIIGRRNGARSVITIG
ncbi:type II secretion system protein N [Ramlibacter rhizophilus]|uniref:Type II secretion system protein N n=1 Tax=Ramlibacter rhizophilus TaxID=1781167 RepID=A0A4Z0BHC1_9BURK|nr:type II secretion system protein N [Ramlibacter rhizophilus]TFY97308.1 type II secretion system protein N [Ramlibacter rhizophilus]